jgi:hypothetical protein
LAYALRDAVRQPHRVGYYEIQFYRSRSLREVVQIHKFRFGYANFILISSTTAIFIYDFWLDDDIALAAE